jgi:dTDP-4-amino-4,6-dideoxygalactose transaminase
MQKTVAVPVLDLKPEIEELWPEIGAAMEKVVRSTKFILGPEVGEFERAAADYLGVKHAIGLNSGTDALIIALRALNIGPGDEVITTPFSFFATAEAISLVGARPVFVDVDLESFNICPEQVQKAITPRTKAIMPVHLFGNPAPMAALLEMAKAHQIHVIEDCAQSFGAKYAAGCQGCKCDQSQPAFYNRFTGTLGDVGAFSFFPTKNLGAYGDAGLLTTHSDAVAEQARMLQVHGSRKRYHHEMLGYNSRLDTLQAAILKVKLPHIDRYNAARRAVAGRYNQALEGVSGIVVPKLALGHVFHQYTVRILGGKRDQVHRILAEQGISSMTYYPVPLHKLPMYDSSLVLPIAEKLASEVLSLPIWPQISPETQTGVVQALIQGLEG